MPDMAGNSFADGYVINRSYVIEVDSVNGVSGDIQVTQQYIGCLDPSHMSRCGPRVLLV